MKHNSNFKPKLMPRRPRKLENRQSFDKLRRRKLPLPKLKPNERKRFRKLRN